MLVNNAYANLAKILANSAVSSNKVSSSSRVEHYSIPKVIFESSNFLKVEFEFCSSILE